MPDLDQDPRDYRAEPLKGEPVFRPGGLRILIAFFAVVAIGLVAAYLTSPLADLGYWLSCRFITGTCL